MDDDDAAARSPGNERTAPCTTPAALDSISLIVPCYSPDRFDDLARLLDSVARQTSPVDELIIVVQQSHALLEMLRDRLQRAATLNVRLLFLDIPPRVSVARNAGLRAATAEVVAFVDDDSILADDWAAMTRRFYGDCHDAVGVAGAILPLWDSPAMEWFPRELYWMLSCTYWTWTSPTPVRNGYGANLSFRRVAFEGGRGFDESLGISGWGVGGWRGVGGEEPELSLRVTTETGRPILYVPDIRVWHRVMAYRLRFRTLMRRAYFEGRLKAVLSSRMPHGGAVLDTERALLHVLVHASWNRLVRGGRHPVRALRQQSVVLLSVLGVACGFLLGKIAGIRVGRRRGRSPARDVEEA